MDYYRYLLDCVLRIIKREVLSKILEDDYTVPSIINTTRSRCLKNINSNHKK